MLWHEHGTTAVCQPRSLFQGNQILWNHSWRHTAAVESAQNRAAPPNASRWPCGVVVLHIEVCEAAP